MPVLVPMSRQAFAAFAAEATEAYAQDHVLAGNWSADEALAKATAQFDKLLPRGFDTPGHFFYDVHDSSGMPSGTCGLPLLASARPGPGMCTTIRIHPDHQRKGHGKAALLALESVAAEMHLPAIRLNVFGHNPRAEALYRSLGYEVTSSSMRKSLGKNA